MRLHCLLSEAKIQPIFLKKLVPFEHLHIFKREENCINHVTLYLCKNVKHGKHKEQKSSF